MGFGDYGGVVKFNMKCGCQICFGLRTGSHALGASHWMVDHVEPNGENRMKCVHGIELEVPCVYCGSLGRFTENKPDDPLVAELASLTRSIQGLSGNVAKLVEDRAPAPVLSEDSRWSDEEISSMSRNPVPPYEFTRLPEIPKDWFKTVKFGPATDHELAALWNWSGHYNSPDPNNKLQDVVNAILKSRGLID